MQLIARISPFRWRLEWVVLLIAATAGVLAEQAREATTRDPYQIITTGRSARASVANVRNEQVTTGMRRGSAQIETRTLVDLHWTDDHGGQRSVEGYRLDPPTVTGLQIDPLGKRWPQYVQILHLDRAEDSRPARSVTVIEQGVTAPAFQEHCRPWRYCRIVVLAPDVLTPSEEAAANVDFVLDRAPHAFRLSLILFVAMLALRLTGLVHNRPSME